MIPRLATLGLLAVPLAPAASEPPTLAELAAAADLVAVVRLRHTEYRPQQGPPRAGFALLEILISYKRPEPADTVAVYAEAGQPQACFYPTAPDAEERYLVFLRRRGDGQYEGEPPYCRLPVHVVAEDGQYALRWPIEGVRPPPLAGRALVFADRAAYLDPARLTSEEIAAIHARWPTVALPDGRLRFAQGVPLIELRPHLFPAGLPPRQPEDRPAPRERE